MKVLVTGGTGFVGRALVKRLLQEGSVDEVVVLSRHCSGALLWEDSTQVARVVSCNIARDIITLHGILAMERPDVIFHLAANPLVRDSSPMMTLDNVNSTHCLLEYCPPNTRFVLASSAAVYGNDAGRGYWIAEGALPSPNSVYGASKVAAEALVSAYTALGKVSGLSLRLAAQVGPHPTHGLLKDVVAKLRSPSPTLQLIGDAPGSIKPYTHVDDTVEAFVQFGLKSDVQGAVNVTVNDQLSVLAVAQIAMEELGIDKPITWLGEGANWPGDNKIVRVDATRAKKLGWAPRLDSAQAIRKAVKEMQ